MIIYFYKLCRFAIIGFLLWPSTTLAFNVIPHEQLLDGLYDQSEVNNPITVFENVFSTLPDHVRIYPSENYYYFRFASNGSWYWGNIRLSPEVRDQGQVHFAYAVHHDPDSLKYILLDKKHDVQVKRVEDFIYQVHFKNKTVTFQLNNDHQRLPEGLDLLNWESWIGRSTDESGFRFLLFFNSLKRHFYWVLDPDQPAKWRFIPYGDHIVIHPDSAFAFYKDPKDGRLVLIGVNRWNIQANNYYDGPFDQLPDNVLVNTRFSEYVQLAYPETQGHINKRGEYNNGMRVGIIPYLSYTSPDVVNSYANQCIGSYSAQSDLYNCLFRDQTRVPTLNPITSYR